MRKGILAAVSVFVFLTLLPVPSFSQVAEEDAELAGPPGQQKPKVPAKPTPRWPDGQPMMGAAPGEKGTWGSCCGRLANDKTPFQPWAKAVLADRDANRLEPHTRCKASGGARQFTTPYGTEIVEFRDDKRIIIFDIGGPHTFRTIYMDGRPHPTDLKPSYYGHSIGRWEGDTLVVDTVGFNERFWMDRAGSPHTETLHFVERFTRTDHDTMKYEVTVEDPGAYTAVWSTVPFTLTWGPDRELFEYVCQQSNYAHELMVGTFERVDRSTTIVP